VAADVRTFLRTVLALAEAGGARNGRKAWQQQVAAWQEDWRQFNERRYRPDAAPIQPEHLVRTLRRVVPADGIVLVDVGVHHNWLVQQWPVYQPQTLLQSWGFAAMGFAVGGVVGAKLAAPDRRAVAVCGDGGFLMTANAVATAVEYGIPATWVVWNNAGYVSIRDLQRGAFGKETTTMFRRESTGEPFSPDYAMLARACGADGIRVTTPGARIVPRWSTLPWTSPRPSPPAPGSCRRWLTRSRTTRRCCVSPRGRRSGSARRRPAPAPTDVPDGRPAPAPGAARASDSSPPAG
jgi:acetolactate synthase-1/2/3 large subunit